jgi:hypothetical protein
MDADREKPPIEPTVEPDTTDAAEPDESSFDAEDEPALRESDGVGERPA